MSLEIFGDRSMGVDAEGNRAIVRLLHPPVGAGLTDRRMFGWAAFPRDFSVGC